MHGCYKTTEQRLRALGMLESGPGQVTVARHYGVQHSTICGIVSIFMEQSTMGHAQVDPKSPLGTRIATFTDPTFTESIPNSYPDGCCLRWSA